MILNIHSQTRRRFSIITQDYLFNLFLIINLLIRDSCIIFLCQVDWFLWVWFNNFSLLLWDSFPSVTLNRMNFLTKSFTFTLSFFSLTLIPILNCGVTPTTTFCWCGLITPSTSCGFRRFLSISRGSPSSSVVTLEPITFSQLLFVSSLSASSATSSASSSTTTSTTSTTTTFTTFFFITLFTPCGSFSSSSPSTS